MQEVEKHVWIIYQKVVKLNFSTKISNKQQAHYEIAFAYMAQVYVKNYISNNKIQCTYLISVNVLVIKLFKKRRNSTLLTEYFM